MINDLFIVNTLPEPDLPISLCASPVTQPPGKKKTMFLWFVDAPVQWVILTEPKSGTVYYPKLFIQSGAGLSLYLSDLLSALYVRKECEGTF